jgi:hypothetical protein
MGRNAKEWVRLEQAKIARQTIEVYRTMRDNFRKGASCS